MEELICNINTISIYKVYTAGYNVFVHVHVKNVERPLQVRGNYKKKKEGCNFLLFNNNNNIIIINII
jgi:hypothetical protein